MAEIAERGFNCIRFEDGAGLLWDKDGNVRNDVLISRPFGKYSKYTTYITMVDGERINVLERLLAVCRAAKKHNLKVILSSWFFLHTNWFCEEKDVQYLFDLTDEEKISFFADELSRILYVLKQENLIDIVAFAEIFNKFDGLPFVGEYRGVDNEKAKRFRLLHEKEIEKLKTAHPDVLFAFDTWTPRVNPELIPRNIDVLNFHCYYLWSVYNAFQKNIIQRTLDEPEIPEDTRYYLKDELVSVADVAREMGVVRTGKEWPCRISLYASIDEKKEPELIELLDDELKKNYDIYLERLYDGVNTIIDTHDKVVPNSRLVMGGGRNLLRFADLSF